MKTDIEIAYEAKPQPIEKIAAKLDCFAGIFNKTDKCE